MIARPQEKRLPSETIAPAASPSPRRALSGGLVALLLTAPAPAAPAPPDPASPASTAAAAAVAERPGESAGRVDLSPARWPVGERQRARAIDLDWQSGTTLARGEHAMIATSSQGGSSVRAGLEALRQGGSAVDAALVVALTQIALVMGSWTSYAGALAMVTYDAESGQVYVLDGGFYTVGGEGDPLSIPPPDGDQAPGRSVLVPGFMAGVQAAHDRFGRLPWGSLFEPAIHFAEEGIELTPGHLAMIDGRWPALSRRPAGRRIFSRPDGERYQAGDRFRQRELAATLRAVAADGADHMYRGPWAEKLVAAVGAAGGVLAMSDLKAYRPRWAPPLTARYRGREIATMALPSHAGIQITEAFNLLAAADLDRSRPYWENPEALYQLIQIARVGPLLSVAPVRAGVAPEALFPGLDLSPAARVRPEHARAVWERISRPGWQRTMRSAVVAASGSHSDCVVVRDASGNMVALTHSINTVSWGASGIFVDGVSISDSGYARRKWVAEAGPGRLLPGYMNPLLVLSDGKPVAASAAIGNGLHEVTVQNVAYLIDFGLDPGAAIGAPKFSTPFYDPAAAENREYYKQRATEGAFSDEVIAAIEALGQALALQPPEAPAGLGIWVGLTVDPETGAVAGGAPAMDGHAEGY